MKTILADGYWKDDGMPFIGMRVALSYWNEIDDEKDLDIFYYLDDEPILGDHGDFVLTEFYEE